MTILPLLLFLSAPPQIFEPTGRYAINSTPDATTASRSQPTSTGGDNPGASGVRDDRYVVVFTSASCSPCQRMKQTTIPALQRAGIAVRVVDINSSEYSSRWSVNLVPTTWVVDRSTRKKVETPLVGYVTAETLLRKVRKNGTTVTRTKTAVSVNGNFFPEREEVILHLLSGSVHRGKFTRSQLDAMTDWQIIDLHNWEHGVRTINGVKQ